MRADLFLSKNNHAKSRSAAAELIKSGVEINGVKIEKPSQNVPDGFETYDVKISEPQKYVSRGGIKLEAALDKFRVSPKGLVCADIGASTGGFTDCLLSHGAEKVYAIDVGHGQLDDKIQNDGRVVSMEGVNARTLTAAMIGRRVPLVVMDVSFISQALIYGAVYDVLEAGGTLISLIKPQFEAGPENVGKGGIVKDAAVRREIVKHLKDEAKKNGLNMRAVMESPITGGDGNVEYLALFKKIGRS
ncbi:MAG: TlyA family RNA methyltransferase [Clostridia bacterium]|nr:TlyA family RNA methyltransferase [Clostridia bacterium]